MSRIVHFKAAEPSLRVVVLARDASNLRRVAWITRDSKRISIGVPRSDGFTRYSYYDDGGFFRSTEASEVLVARHPPIAKIRGLLQLLTVEVGAQDRLHSLPFKRRFESIFIRPHNGRVSFNLGLLEPGEPQALDSIGARRGVHFRLITKSSPWILLWNATGFESAPRKAGGRTR